MPNEFEPILEGVGEGFDPEGEGFDIPTARKHKLERGFDPESGEMHMQSRLPLTEEEALEFGVPPGSGLILKGRRHPTFDKAIKADEALGFKLIRRGNRYFTVPIR